jgi:hypothetical protein
MLIQEKLWKPKNDFFFLFAESYGKALGTGLKLSVQYSLPRGLLSAQKNYLFKKN